MRLSDERWTAAAILVCVYAIFIVWFCGFPMAPIPLTEVDAEVRTPPPLPSISTPPRFVQLRSAGTLASPPRSLLLFLRRPPAVACSLDHSPLTSTIEVGSGMQMAK
jgi:hypothetical protein